MFEYALKKFQRFINDNFDIEDRKIKHKVIHTYNVVKMAKYISDNLNLKEEDKELAQLIALLHDIGRFPQAVEFKSFREDRENVDHAILGVQILFKNNMIRDFVLENKYDEIIKKAIANHSKYILEKDGMSERELLHSKIIRDADKLDSFRVKEKEDIYIMANITKEELEKSLISDDIYNDFLSEKTILSSKRKTGVDIWVSYIAFIFDLNFSCSLKYIKEHNYIDTLVDRFSYKEINTKNRMEIIRKFSIQYLNKKIK